MAKNDKKTQEKVDLDKSIDAKNKPEEQSQSGNEETSEKTDFDKDVVEEEIKIEDEPQEEAKTSEEVSEEIVDEGNVKEQQVKEVSEVKKEEKPKQEDKKKQKKKAEHKDDFKYIVRIANTDIDGEKTVLMGLTQIKGIGRHMATLIADDSKLDRNKKFGDLSDSEIDKIRVSLEKIPEIAPSWMLNHRKDMDSGKDIHLLSSEIDLKLRDDINLLKMIRSYRGIRHEVGLRVRGQRTKANNRRGLALGVSKKREPQKQT